MSATFPPLSGGSGPSSAGLVVGQSVASFIPDASGNAPAGWAFLDGTVSSGYDQGAALSDIVPTGDLTSAGSEVTDTPRLILSGENSLSYSQFEHGWLEQEITPASEVLLAQAVTKKYFIPMKNSPTAVVGVEIAGATVIAVHGFHIIAETPVAGPFGPAFEVDLLVNYGTSDGLAWAVRSTWNSGSGEWTPGTPLELTDVVADQAPIYVKRDGNLFSFIATDKNTYGAYAGRIDVSDMSLTVLDYAEDYPAAMGGLLDAQSLSTGLFALRNFFNPNRTLLRKATVTATEIRVDAIGASNSQKSSGVLGRFIPLSDGNFWDIGLYGVYRLNPTTLSRSMLAGRHPALTLVPQAFEYQVLGLAAPADLLNESLGLSVAYRDRASATPKSCVVAPARITLGSMFASFVRKAVYTG